MAAKRLALNVIENCAVKLEPGIKQFLISSTSGDSGSMNCEINCHAVLHDIYSFAPQVLTGVVPYLTGELLVIIAAAFMYIFSPVIKILQVVMKYMICFGNEEMRRAIIF